MQHVCSEYNQISTCHLHEEAHRALQNGTGMFGQFCHTNLLAVHKRTGPPRQRAPPLPQQGRMPAEGEGYKHEQVVAREPAAWPAWP